MTWWTIARQPRWIGVLFATLAVAAIFVLLSQWQIERSIEHATVIERDTETVLALDEVAEPSGPVTSVVVGQKVKTSGSFVAGDASVISGRLNHGATGYWVTAHLITEDGASLAVATGWTDDVDAANSARDIQNSSSAQVTIVGRYMASEGALDDDIDEGERSAMSVATLLNEWAEPTDTVYGGYLILDEPLDGLTAIDSPVPGNEVELNWLNIFYAVEWIVFAGFALYLWYRLVKDAAEREELEREERELAEVN